MQLNGQIIKFHPSLGIGVIRAEDGRSYRFAGREIVNTPASLVGSEVDFLVEARQPKAIVVLEGSPWSVFAGKAA